MALCVPLLGFVTTCAVKQGEELFATYGHTYWLQEDLPCSDAVQEAMRAPSMEVCMWQIATDKKHGKAIVALDQFLMDHSEAPEDAAQYLDTLDLAEGATTTTTAMDDATVVSEPPLGFGQATRKPKGGGKPKRR